MVSKKCIKLVLSGMVALSLAGCKTEVNVNTYISDAFSNDNVTTPATMLLEIPSCSSQDEYSGKVLAIFSTSSEAKITGCEQKGMESFLAISLNAEIASKNSNHDLIIFREIIETTVDVEGGTYEVRGLKAHLNTNFITRVQTLLSENFQTLTYDDIKLEVTINNDERNDTFVTANYVWVDNEPYATFYKQKLPRRGRVNLKFSNLLSDLALRNKQPNVAYVYRSADR